MELARTTTREKNGLFGEPKARVVNLDDRDIYFTGYVGPDSMLDLVRELKNCERKSIKALKTVKREMDAATEKLKEEDIQFINFGTIAPAPINLHINSDGGSVFDVFFAIDQIKNLKVPVHTIVCGMAASAATILSCAGEKRYITKNAHMLIHEIRSGFWGKKSEIDEHFENTSHLSQLIIDYYKEHTKMTEDDLKEILKHDYYWDAQKCVEKGLVDGILGG